MQNISCSLTADQILDRTKTVTRRLGWKTLKSGTRLRVCRKCMGLKKGEKPETLAYIDVASVRRERLNEITRDDVEREGFPDMTPRQFISMFCASMKCKPTDFITRIEFTYAYPLCEAWVRLCWAMHRGGPRDRGRDAFLRVYLWGSRRWPDEVAKMTAAKITTELDI